MHSEERKMEIVLLVRDTEAYRKSRMTDVREFGHTQIVLYPSKSFFEANFGRQCFYSTGS